MIWMQMRIKLLSESALPPRYAQPGDAGADLFSDEDAIVHARGQKLIRTGVAFEIPEGYFGLVRPRSGLATKYGIGMNSSGVIDSGYRGEVSVTLMNHTDANYMVNKCDRIAQILILPVEYVTFNTVSQLSDSDRGTHGYGSTGYQQWA